MSYSNHFKLADDMITHLNSSISQINDPFILTRYVGFVSVAAVTVYELAVKEIFIDFAEKKNKVFGTFTSSHFDRINGRIKNRDIKNEYVKKFGEKYLNRYKKMLDKEENMHLRTTGTSIKSSYANIITWRNQFAHEGKITSTVTYQEVVNSYETGKKLINCLAETMKR